MNNIDLLRKVLEDMEAVTVRWRAGEIDMDQLVKEQYPILFRRERGLSEFAYAPSLVK